jgi:hypothetical protein
MAVSGQHIKCVDKVFGLIFTLGSSLGNLKSKVKYCMTLCTLGQPFDAVSKNDIKI